MTDEAHKPPRTKRGPLTATERLTAARDQQARVVDKLAIRLTRLSNELDDAKGQYARAVNELEQIKRALPPPEAMPEKAV